ncbi:class I SAM-dependent methyltransferase [Streptomyces graminifolii]|uniref:class I SAM-dependent methyltransferase n=1 Tax=Streptomyces graminifolii TaxID=1266771 RepID=UPI004059789F
MSSPVREFTAADWDTWYTTARPSVVTDKECEAFRRMVDLQPGMTAADLACGSGQWTRQLAAWGATVSGYDFSTEALRQAHAAGPRDQLAYVRWDITAEPIPPGLQPASLDLVTCRYALPYLDHARLATDIGRWLKPSGTFYALVRIAADDAQAEASSRDDGRRDDPLGPFHRALSQKQIESLGSGWASRTTYRLSSRSCALLLREYR